MRKARYFLFLAASVAIGAGAARAWDNQPSTCASSCSGSTLQVTCNTGGPLQTWFGANVACIPYARSSCSWCMQIQVSMWNSITDEFVPVGTRNYSPTATCGTTTFTAVLDPSWGVPPIGQLYLVQSDIWGAACGVGGPYQGGNKIQFVATK
jgi:hypothetical protein